MEKTRGAVYRTLKISEDVVELVVKYAVLAVDGVAGFYKYRRRSPIEMKLDAEFPEVTVKVNLTAVCRAKTVCESIQKKVRDDVMSMTGIALGAVNVQVEGIAF